MVDSGRSRSCLSPSTVHHPPSTDLQAPVSSRACWPYEGLPSTCPPAPRKSQQEESNPQVAVLQTAGPPRPFRHCRLRAEEEGVEPSRHCCSAVFETAAIAHWLAFPGAVGSEGVEPSPHGLKDRYAALTPRPR